MKEYLFTTVFGPDVNGGYSVTVPSLPGCISEGDSFEEANANIREAIELYLDVHLETNSQPPIETAHPIISPVEVRLAAR